MTGYGNALNCAMRTDSPSTARAGERGACWSPEVSYNGQ